MEYKFQVSDAKIDNEQGLIEAHVNTMGIRDHDGDIIDPKAFNASIKNNLPIPVLSGHDQKQIVGKVLFARVDEVEDPEHRLLAVMQMNLNTQMGRDAYSNISEAYVREWSVGFNIPGADSVEWEKRGKENIRRIKNLDWVEVSSVVRGASPSTMTIAAKSEEPDEIEELEPAVIQTNEDEVEPVASTTEEPPAVDTTEVELALLDLEIKLSNQKVA